MRLCSKWWPGTESNRRRQPFQGCALPTELPGRCVKLQSTKATALPKLDILRIERSIMDEMRLGDIIDDHCIKCRRVTNHAIVSLVDGQAAKVRCRTCYHDHDYRHEQAPPSKKELKRAEAEAQAAAAAAASDGAVPALQGESESSANH